MGHNSLVLSYSKSTGIPRVDELSTEPSGFGTSHLLIMHKVDIRVRSAIIHSELGTMKPCEGSYGSINSFNDVDNMSSNRRIAKLIDTSCIWATICYVASLLSEAC